MDTNSRKFVIFGATSAALAIGLGAFGAHVLETRLTSAMLVTYHKAVLYHLFHSLGLFAAAFVCFLKPGSRAAAVSGWLMASGVILFCGSLYLLAVTGAKWLGAVTPLGGLAFIAAWLLMAAAALRS